MDIYYAETEGGKQLRFRYKCGARRINRSSADGQLDSIQGLPHSIPEMTAVAAAAIATQKRKEIKVRQISLKSNNNNNIIKFHHQLVASQIVEGKSHFPIRLRRKEQVFFRHSHDACF